MDTELLPKYRASLRGADVESTVVPVDEFNETMERIISSPAVGAAFPFTEVSLDTLPVISHPSTKELQSAETGVTGSRLGIAALGTIAIESRTEGDELVSLYPEHHIAVIRDVDILPDLASAFSRIESQFHAGHESLVLETGPSATGDMGALVQGVHGPERVTVVILETNE